MTDILISTETANKLLVEHGKIINLINIKGNKTYFHIESSNNRITCYFKNGVKGLAEYSFPISLSGSDNTDICIGLDFSKFLNALQKIQITDNYVLKLSTKGLLIKSDSFEDKVMLSISNIDESELESINGFWTKIKDKETIPFSLDSDTETFFKTALNLMSAFSIASSVYLTEKSGIYTDKSIVFKMKDRKEALPIPPMFFHSDTIKFMDVTKNFQNQFTFYSDLNAFRWTKDNLIDIFFIQEESDVALPDDDMIAEITPEPENGMEIEAIKLSNALDFFNGFYEGSIWKTVDFIFKNSKVELNYNSVSSQVQKIIDNPTLSDKEIKFSIVSDSLKSVLNTSEKSEIVKIHCQNGAPGILVESEKYISILANLEE